MKQLLASISIVCLLIISTAKAQNVVIEPSGITPLPAGGGLWQDLSGTIQYSSGQVIIAKSSSAR